jgi:transcriptional regulator with XRE-family HTH domain
MLLLMDPCALADVPSLLRAWRRDIAQLSQTRALRGLDTLGHPIAASTLSQWESGTRRRGAQSIDHLQALDDCYAAGGALVGLARAVDTPRGLPPRATWSHNYSAEGGPVWAWIRPGIDEHEVAAQCVWGPIRMRLKRPSDHHGVVITSPGSTGNPALSITLARPGWVDFGQGTVPRSLGIPVINGALHVRLASSRGPIVTRFVDRALTRTSRTGDWLGRMKRFARGNGGLVDDALNSSEIRHPVADFSCASSSLDQPPPNPLAGVQLRALREARHLSQKAVAFQASTLDPESPVSEAQIRSIERGAVPRPRRLASRLDTVLGADGHACFEDVPVSRQGSKVTIPFPPYWIGPVSVTVFAPSAANDVTDIYFRWDPWELRARVRSGVPLTFRRSDQSAPDLRGSVPDNWDVYAHIGHHPGALDANSPWDSLDVGIYDHVLGVYLRVFRRDARQLDHLMRGEDIF